MANPAIRGVAVVFGAGGTILPGAATAILSQNQSASVSSADEVAEFKDSQGKVVTIVNIETIWDAEFEFIPTGTTSSTLANAVTASALVSKNDKVITSTFAVADYNKTWRVMEVSSKINNSGALVYNLKVRKNEADFSAAPLS